ncbi:MAG: zinc ABC transporter substrate-binding protein [Magnetococcales bacterium]|nr:zinc ABC transporter substrate-binding protein [Magnetococcales bacterium]
MVVGGFFWWVCALLVAPSQALALEVVVSIKPLHALAAAVMGEQGRPGVLIQGSGSPHTYTLRPSEARALERADLILWGGEELETFLVRPLEHLPKKAMVVPLLRTEGLIRLPTRAGGAWEEEDHETHDHQEEHGVMDPHVWLDPRNAKIMAVAIARSLSRVDPAHGEDYRKNASDLGQRLDGLDQELAQALAPVRERHYIVFHDAYQYLEHRYGLGTVGSIMVHPDRTPGVKRIREIGQRLRDTHAVCLFTEPQFSRRLAATVAESHPVRIGTLDPLGAALPEGPEFYFQLLRELARSLLACLSP